MLSGVGRKLAHMSIHFPIILNLLEKLPEAGAGLLEAVEVFEYF